MSNDSSKQASMIRHPAGANDGATQDDSGTSVTITRETGEREMTTIDGDSVRYDSNERRDTHVSGEWPASADEHVRGLIDSAQHEREARENARANHRNFNRMLTLTFTLIAGLAITFLLTTGALGSFGVMLAPYSFVITVAGDTVLTAYALIKHY